MNTIFGDFRPFSAIYVGVFLRSQCYNSIFCKHLQYFEQKAPVFLQNVLAKIFSKSVPETNRLRSKEFSGLTPSDSEAAIY
jgi:hypothetical protein